MYYLKNCVNVERLLKYIDLLIYKDEMMRENTMEGIEIIADGIVEFFRDLQ